MPPDGLVISQALADVLNLRVGDMAEVEMLEGRRQTVMQPVSAIVTGYIGLSAYMDLDAMNRMLGEGSLISGVHVAIDLSQRDSLFAALKATPVASFIGLQYAALAKVP